MKKHSYRVGLLLLLFVLNAECFGWQQQQTTTTTRRPLAVAIQERANNVTTTAITTTITTLEQTTNCLKMQCKFVCFNGLASEIAADINKAANTSVSKCDTLEELRLYNYRFENNTISHGFLQEFGNRVQMLYIACSPITTIAGGAFANGIFRELYLDDLRLTELSKSFFEGISSNFEALSVVQKEWPLPSVEVDFLDNVKFQIKSLTLQVGIGCTRNLTGSDNLLNTLWYADFSYNNLGERLQETTFGQLSMVEHLDLSHSNITYLPDNIFYSITRTLEFLDLSYNHLTTISMEIFGWHTVLSELQLALNDNDWDCSCELQAVMKELSIYQTNKKVYCKTPSEYEGWTVFDKRLCSDENSTVIISTPSPEKTTGAYCSRCEIANGDDGPSSTSTNMAGKITLRPPGAPTQGFQPIPTIDYDVFLLECLPLLEVTNTNYQRIKRPTVEFNVEADIDEVDIIVHTTTIDDAESYILIWFTNVTKQYYEMEINYNEFGLGCYGDISYRTKVANLVPDECYTFCVVARDQMTVSPLNCKSTHVTGNLAVTTWETEDSPQMGIALVVFGIVVFAFLGIVAIFLLLKHKPTLLKGSKRVGTSLSNPAEIVVFPKDKKSFKYKQEQLASRCSKGTLVCTKRRGSNESSASYQSYMNNNLYEVIPAYLRFDESYADITSLPDAPLPPTPPPLPALSTPGTPPTDSENNSADMVSYAEIPYRTKRTSDDPLPEVPREQQIPALPLNERAPIADAEHDYCERQRDSEV